jgi:hypothetical protein
MPLREEAGEETVLGERLWRDANPVVRAEDRVALLGHGRLWERRMENCIDQNVESGVEGRARRVDREGEGIEGDVPGQLRAEDVHLLHDRGAGSVRRPDEDRSREERHHARGRVGGAAIERHPNRRHREALVALERDETCAARETDVADLRQLDLRRLRERRRLRRQLGRRGGGGRS